MFQILPGGKNFSEYALLRDGESVLLRVATTEDVGAVDALMRSVSRQSLHMRFMGAVSHVSRSMVESLCAGEPQDRLCLLAVAGQGADARVVGMGNYFSLGVGGTAEVAFLVRDDFQGRGLSTLLLERLAGIAAGKGFIGFEAEVLSENQAMFNVFRDSGFEIHQSAIGGGSLHVEFPVTGQAPLRERGELRERIATANSLLPLLSPRSVAVVGASRDPSAAGSRIFRAIVEGNFTGTVFPVNNQTTSVLGVRAYSSVANLPDPPEMVVIAVPAANVLAVADESLKAGARGLLVVTSGFAESGPDGAVLQRRLVEMVRSHGARLIGPNCLGLMNTHESVRLNASLASKMAPGGRIGFYSHSAALGLVILDYAAERGLGFSTFVSAGNRADVSGNDLLQFWDEDSSTDIALLYLETFGNPRRFARLARRISYRKPILCVKSARSRAGRDAARARIGAVAQSETNVETLFHQAGVVRADTLEEMFDVATLLAHQPLPRGNRVAIVSNSGGVLTICADACDARGLSVAAADVVDLGAFATPEAYEAAVRQAAESPEVDALIVIFACVGGCDPESVGRAIRRGVLVGERRTGVPKPALLCLMGSAGAVQIGIDVFPSYRFPESAAQALSRAVQYAAFRKRPPGRLIWNEDVDAAGARQAASEALDAGTGGSVRIEGAAAWKILRSFGITGLAAGAVPTPVPGGAVEIEVRPDPSFGPLVRLLRDGRECAIRITPLTDHDVAEMVEAAGLPSDRGAEDLLGRVSQLIEELPWLAGMEAEIVRVESGTGAEAMVLAPEAQMDLLRVAPGDANA